jgi:hypothetical protein
MKKTGAGEVGGGGQDLNAVIDAFERWRAEKRPGERIPQRLWQASISLHPRYSVYQISRALRLDFVDLRDRVGRSGSGKKGGGKGQKGPQFVQLPMAMGGGVADCRVKVRGGRKVRITVKLRAAAPGTVVELLRELWSRAG